MQSCSFFSESCLRSIYDMAFFTYLIAFGHFTSEVLIFRTAKLNVGVMSPLIVACGFFSETRSFQ
jgi:hypothetical protein